MLTQKRLINEFIKDNNIDVNQRNALYDFYYFQRQEAIKECKKLIIKRKKEVNIYNKLYLEGQIDFLKEHYYINNMELK